MVVMISLITVHSQKRELRYKLYTLPQYIRYAYVVCLTVIRVQHKHTPCHGIHNILTWLLHNDITHKVRRYTSVKTQKFIEFLKLLLELAREAAQAEKEVVPEEEIDKGKAALTELFNGMKNPKTPVIVERIVTDIDDIVKIVRFDGWQNTTAGKQEVKKALRSVVWIKYKIKDKEVFDKAYEYIEQYY